MVVIIISVNKESFCVTLIAILLNVYICFILKVNFL